MANKSHSEPNLFGGYTHYDAKGHKIGSSEPGIFGGYTNYDAKGHKIGRSDPSVFGGYTHYDNHGHKTGRSDVGAFGSYYHYDAKNKRTGRSDPGAFGGYTNTTSKDGCYIATCVYGSYDCPEVWVLRRFRDDILRKTAPGRAFVHAYYAISPTLVKKLGDQHWFRVFWLKCLNSMVSVLMRKGIEDTPYADRTKQ